MLYPLNELADRYLIDVIKHSRTTFNRFPMVTAYRSAIMERLGVSGDDSLAYHVGHERFDELLDELHAVHLKMWDGESKIFDLEKHLSLASIGKAALEIRKLNRERIRIKNQIAEEFGDGFRDEKAYYATV